MSLVRCPGARCGTRIDPSLIMCREHLRYIPAYLMSDIVRAQKNLEKGGRDHGRQERLDVAIAAAVRHVNRKEEE